MPFDPVAGEVVRDAEDEGSVLKRDTARLPEPGPVGRLVGGAPEPTCHFVPQSLRSQLYLVLHSPSRLPVRCPQTSGHPTNLPKPCKCGVFAGFSRALDSLHSCGEPWGKLRH